MDLGHIPVMLEEVLNVLRPEKDQVIVDGTFGGGSYTRAILNEAMCKVVAIDRDPTAYARAQDLQKEMPDRVIPIHGAFSEMDTLIANENIGNVDAVVLDIGVSSYQIDQAERGFSFMKEGPLDMRMDTSQGQTAADIVNNYEETDLANLIWKYGQEKLSRKIAKAVVKARAEKPFETTKELAECVADIIPFAGKHKTHPATKTFQALRIAVNDELGELEKGLEAAKIILKNNGKLVVVTFHSLEDSIVKDFLRQNSKEGQQQAVSRYMPEQPKSTKAIDFKLVDRKAIAVSAKEAKENPRARSAKLRWAVRTIVQEASA
ncbi:MAG: 16S rRNA (cytosine(1402)-N(4))-methyltransferase [Micavibrio sp.]|nr:16S rRNA (cytosine(1402)-N(4))-methyltransferase [Micavibrio sp.]